MSLRDQLKHRWSHRKTVPKWAFNCLLAIVIVYGILTLLTLLRLSGNLAVLKVKQVQAGQQWIYEYDKETEYIEVEKTVFEIPSSPEIIIEMIFKNDAQLAKRVAFCESSMDPYAANKNSSARGLFQVMQSWHEIDERWLYDPIINTLVAKKLYDEQGWTPWEASRHCWQKNELKITK